MTTALDEGAGSDRCATCSAPSDGRLLCDRCRPGAAPSERLETRARRCDVLENDGSACKTFTLHEACDRHRPRAGADSEVL